MLIRRVPSRGVPFGSGHPSGASGRPGRVAGVAGVAGVGSAWPAWPAWPAGRAACLASPCPGLFPLARRPFSARSVVSVLRRMSPTVPVCPRGPGRRRKASLLGALAASGPHSCRFPLFFTPKFDLRAQKRTHNPRMPGRPRTAAATGPLKTLAAGQVPVQPPRTRAPSSGAIGRAPQHRAITDVLPHHHPVERLYQPVAVAVQFRSSDLTAAEALVTEVEGGVQGCFKVP